MSDTTPNSLEPTRKVSVARMSKWPMYAVLLAGLFLLGILVYSVNFAHNQQEEQAGTPKVDIKEEEKPLLMGEGKGLALAPPAGSPALAMPEAKPAVSFPHGRARRALSFLSRCWAPAMAKESKSEQSGFLPFCFLIFCLLIFMRDT